MTPTKLQPLFWGEDTLLGLGHRACSVLKSTVPGSRYKHNIYLAHGSSNIELQTNFGARWGMEYVVAWESLVLGIILQRAFRTHTVLHPFICTSNVVRFFFVVVVGQAGWRRHIHSSSGSINRVVHGLV